MKLFKSYAFTWWQIGIFKLALLAIGIAIGAYWHDFFGANLTALIIVAVIASAYILYVSLKQRSMRDYKNSCTKKTLNKRFGK